MALFANGDGDLVAYFDESMSGDRLPLTSVAGYLFEPSAYTEFDSGMRDLLRRYQLCYFRTAECFHCKGQFEKYNGSDPEPEEAEREVIRLIRKCAILGVGAAVSEAKYRLLQPMLTEQIMGSAYSMLCQWCLQAIGNWANENCFSGGIFYRFEAGCSMQSDANRDLNKIAAVKSFRNQYRYAGHAFDPKHKMRGLQAADLLAWFCRREAEELRKFEPLKPEGSRRLDFQALIGRDLEELKGIRHVFKYFNDSSLKRFFSQDENSDPSIRWYDPEAS